MPIERGIYHGFTFLLNAGKTAWSTCLTTMHQPLIQITAGVMVTIKRARHDFLRQWSQGGSDDQTYLHLVNGKIIKVPCFITSLRHLLEMFSVLSCPVKFLQLDAVRLNWCWKTLYTNWVSPKGRLFMTMMLDCLQDRQGTAERV